MRKHNLVPNEGLSLSQAQSISNLCNQRASEIDSILSHVNNFSKTVKVGSDNHTLQSANPIPENVFELLMEKAKLHGCQAFLMENINMKEKLLHHAKTEKPDVSSVVFPEEPNLVEFKKIQPVDEEWGWEQLTTDELNEYHEVTAYASHIGQFIHKGKPLDVLRNNLPNIPSIDWMELKAGEKTPVEIKVHHTSKQLLAIHESLAAEHRVREQRVNYFKAKVKNLVTEENARIANLNATSYNEAAEANSKLNVEYQKLYNAAVDAVGKINSDFEKKRQENIREIASMRIKVDKRFQETIDMFLGQLKEKTE